MTLQAMHLQREVTHLRIVPTMPTTYGIIQLTHETLW